MYNDAAFRTNKPRGLPGWGAPPRHPKISQPSDIGSNSSDLFELILHLPTLSLFARSLLTPPSRCGRGDGAAALGCGGPGRALPGAPSPSTATPGHGSPGAVALGGGRGRGDGGWRERAVAGAAALLLLLPRSQRRHRSARPRRRAAPSVPIAYVLSICTAMKTPPWMPASRAAPPRRNATPARATPGVVR
jgi:hypothetical protein